MSGPKSFAHFKAHPDDEGVDRIEIVAVPRYKQSGLSGDEWRVSAVVRFYRKGKLVGEKGYSGMKYAVAFLGGDWHKLPEISDTALWGLDASTCAQFSCAKQAVTVLEIKKEYSDRGEGPLPESGLSKPRRAFCSDHKRRGDCGREDADDNYTVPVEAAP